MRRLGFVLALLVASLAGAQTFRHSRSSNFSTGQNCLDGTCTTYIQSDGTTITEHGDVSVSGSLTASTVTASTSVQTPDIKGAGGQDRILLPSGDVTTIKGGTNTANGVAITGTASGTAPSIAAAGSDTNVDLMLKPQGTGKVVVNADLQANNGVIRDGAGSARIIATTSGQIAIVGTAANSGTAIAGVVKNTATLSTTGAKAWDIYSDNGTTEQAYLIKDANGWNWRVEGKPVPTYNATGANAKTMLAGYATLSAGSVAVGYSTAFATNPVCTVTDNTAVAAVKFATTTTTLTIAGTGTDSVAWICIGDR